MSATFQQVLVLTALLAGLGLLMVLAGVEKHLLSWKRPTCPVCGSSNEHGCRCRVR
ncbi:MAG: hypothetical protein M3327_15190 [Actinomycetota bacterium]|nr:hypothetical protein [Actinomycetota bacterium]